MVASPLWFAIPQLRIGVVVGSGYLLHVFDGDGGYAVGSVEVREGEGFRDITTYDLLRANYDMTVGDRKEWRARARHYGVKPPPELLMDDMAAGPLVDSAVNGQTASAEPALESA